MSQEGNTALSPSWRNLLGLGFYKRSQGRLMRQVTFGAIALIVLTGTWSLNGMLLGAWSSGSRYGLCAAVAAAGCWLAFRLVNYPRFADFLISVEVEMNKVTWPTRLELMRATIVVIVTMFGLALTLFLFDVLWQTLLGKHGLDILGG